MKHSPKKNNILFLCTGNSCRSQMAEGFAKKYIPDFNIYSAGIIKSSVNPLAIRAMKKKGIDISQQQSNSVNDYQNLFFDYVISLCDHAHQTCPQAKLKHSFKIHHSFDDPPALSKDSHTAGELDHIYDRVCSEINTFIIELPSKLSSSL